MSGLEHWLQTPPGGYALAWEQAQYNALVADIFGYHALQLNPASNLPAVDALATNRMPHRWRAALTLPGLHSDEAAALDTLDTHTPPCSSIALVTDLAALPFPEASLDLVALPHTLAYCSDPAAALREVARVLVHEGCMVVSGFNRASLWGLSGALPADAAPIGARHLRAMLNGTELELETVRYGGHGWAPRAPSHTPDGPMQGPSPHWSARLWPARGALWCAVAVKRSPGPKLAGQIWKTQLAAANAQPSVAQRTEPATDAVN